MKPFYYLTLISFFLFPIRFALGQACDPNTPSFTVDLTGQPAGVWTSPNTVREGLCCGLDPNANPPIRCVEFVFSLDTAAQGIRFDIVSGAVPPGSLGYQIGCGPYYQVGSNICLNGPGPHRLTFCEPGNNKNRYSITSIAKPKVSAPIVVSDGCMGTLIAAGFIKSSITWSSVPSNPVYDSYLSCLSGCDTVIATMQPGAPSYVDYQVTGVPLGGCKNTVVSEITRIYFVNNKKADIEPKDPVICYGGTNATITAYGTGGAPPYTYLWSTGETTQSINVGVGTYWVQIKDTTSCPVATDTVNVTAYLSPIVADAGPDATGCANNPSVTLSGTVYQATGGIWSGGNGTYSPSDTSLNAVYTPTPAEIAAGTVEHILTTTGNGPCPAEKDSMKMTIIPAPVVNAGPDQTVCANNNQVQLNGTVSGATGGTWSGGTGTFSPGRNSLNALYVPSASEITAGTVSLTLTSTGNGICNPVSDQMNISITPAPVVNAGLDQTVCANNAVVNLSGNVSVATGGIWTGGKGTFSPSVSALNAVYTPSSSEIAAGQVTLTLTSTGNGNCKAVSDPMTVFITPAPTVNPGTPPTVCANNVAATLSGSVTIATGGTWSGGAGTFSPGRNALNTVYTPSAGEISAGSVTLTLTTTGNGKCKAVSAPVTVTITPAPVVSAGPDQSVCANNASITLAGSVSVTGGGVWSGGNGAFSPNRETLNASYTPTASEISTGTVTLTLTSTNNGNCKAVSDQVTFTITPAPTVNAGPDQIVCANNDVINLSGSVTIATGGTWSGGNGSYSPGNTSLTTQYTPSASEVSAGTVSLTLTSTGNGTCKPVTDVMNVQITPAPTVNPGSTQTVCANNDVVQLKGSVTVSTGGVWSGGAGTFNPGRSTLKASYTPAASEITAGSVSLTLTTTGNGKCKAVSAPVNIQITNAPVVNAGPNQTVCANNASLSLAGTVTVATGGTWSGGSGVFTPGRNVLNPGYKPSATELASGSVLLTLTSTGNGNCKAVSDQMNISITPAPVVNAGPDKTVCANNAAVSLSGSVSVASGAVWSSSGSGTFSPGTTSLNTVYTPSAYEKQTGKAVLKITSTGNGNCLPVSDFMVLTITPAPVANAGPDQTVCANNATVQLNGQVQVASGGQWSGGTGTFAPASNDLQATYSPSPAEITAGTVTLILTTTGNGTCKAVTDTITITITPAPVIDAGPDQSVCANNSTAVLNGSVSVATGGVWSGGNGTFSNSAALATSYIPSASEVTSGSVILKLTSTGNGNCFPVSDTVKVLIGPSPVANAGVDFSICGNNPNAQLNASVTNATGGVWSGGKGSFSTSDTDLNAIYTVSPAEITVGTVTLTLTTTGNGNCLPVSDKITISIMNPQPTVSAGADQVVCGLADSVALNGIVKAASGGIWQTTGGGTFSPSTSSLTPYYHPTSADKTAGDTIVFTLTTTGTAPCPAVSDTMHMVFTSVPSVNAGPNQIACSNSVPVLQFNGSGSPARWSGGAGVYAPNDSTLNASYTPTASEYGTTVKFVLTTIANAACSPVSDSVFITFEPGPEITTPGNFTVCADTAYLALSATVKVATQVQWSSSGTGKFSDSSAVSTNYYPSATDTSNGTINFVVTTLDNGVCQAATAKLTVTVNPAPTINAGPDQTVCADTSGVQLSGKVYVASAVQWSTAGSGVFSGGNTLLNPVYQLSASDTASGKVLITIASTNQGMCKQVKDSLLISVLPAPTIYAGPDQTVCADTAAIALNAQVYHANGAVWTSSGSGVFSPSTTNPDTYKFSGADTAAHQVYFYATTTGNGMCKPVVDTVQYSILPAPIVNAGPDATICADKTSVNLQGTLANASGIQWTTSGSGSFSPDSKSLTPSYQVTSADTSRGLVTFTLTSTGNGMCKPVTDYTNVVITPAPEIDLGGTIQVCVSADSISVKGAITVATGITWTSGGNGSFSPGSTPEEAYYHPDTTDKTAGQVMIYGTTSGNGGCNPVTDSVLLIFAPFPVPNAGPDVTVCADSADISLSATATNTSRWFWYSVGPGTFSNSAALNTLYFPSASDTAQGYAQIYFTADSNAYCPSVTDTLTITITPAPSVSAGTDQTICANNPVVQLQGAVTVATGGNWSGGSGSFSPNTSDLHAQYTPSPSEINAGQADMLLTTTGNGLCKPVTDTMTIHITPSPLANAGPDITVCANNDRVDLDATVSIATGGMWTGGKGSFSPDSTSLQTAYFPDASEIAAGKANLILTTTGNGNCLPVSDSLVVTITPPPVVTAGNYDTVCANNSLVTLNGKVTISTGGTWSGGSGIFSPDKTLAAQNYAPSAGEIKAGKTTLVLTSTGNGNCLAETDTLQITITPAPVVNAGPDITVCADTSSVALTGQVSVVSGGVWSTSGSGTWQDSLSLVSSYFPSTSDTAAGMVHLVLTSTGNSNCLAVSDTTVLTIKPAPVVSTIPDFTVCKSAQSIQLAGYVSNVGGGQWNSSGTGNFYPNNTQLSTRYYLSSSDTAGSNLIFVLTSTGNGLCKSQSDTLQVSFEKIPIVSTLSQTICADSSGAVFQATFRNASNLFWLSGGSGTFVPDTGATVTYQPSQADIAAQQVKITAVTAGSKVCTSDSTFTTLIITPLPIAQAGSDITVCADSAVARLSGSATNPLTYSWSSQGSGNFSPSNTQMDPIYTASAVDILNGSVNLILTVYSNPECSPDKDTVNLRITPAPVVNAGADTTVCPEGTVSLNGSIRYATGGVWSTSGSGTFSDSNALAGTYFLSTTDKQTGTVLLTLTTTGNGLCKAKHSSRTVTIKPEPHVTAGPTQIVCKDAEAVAFSGSVTVATGGIWTTSGSGIFEPNNRKMLVYYYPSQQDKQDSLIHIYFTSTGTSACKAVTDSVSLIFISPPSVNAGQDKTVCIQDNLVPLDGKATNASGELWTSRGNGSFTPSDTNLQTHYQPSVSDTTSKLIQLALTGTNAACFTQDSLYIHLYPAPWVSLHQRPVCIGDPAIITTIPKSFNASADSGFTWYFNNHRIPDTSQDLTVTQSGVYAVHYRVGECVVSDTSVVNFYAKPQAQTMGTVLFCKESDHSAQLDAGNAYAYYWLASGDSGRYYTATDTGYYYFRIYNEHNCYVNDSILLKNACPPRIFPANAFSPNGDQINPYFIVSGKYFKNFTITIFNRWGEIIFYSEDPKKGWDGNYRGKAMPPGVYPYLIEYEAEFKEFDEGKKVIEGSVTVVR